MRDIATMAALARCLRNPQLYSRVRAEACAVLAVNSAGTDGAGHNLLLQYVREWMYLPRSASVRSNHFADRSEYFVRCALARCLPAVKGRDGMVPATGKNH